MNDALSLMLAKRAKYLETIIGQKTASLKGAPDGRLQCSSKNRGKRREFYCMTGPGRAGRKYIPVSHVGFAKALAQKEYDAAVLKAAQAEQKWIRRLVKQRASGLPESYYSHCCPSRQILIDPICLPDNEYVEKWSSVEYPKQGFSSDDPEFFTDKMERVRSKTEVIIANTLRKYHIPYRYEYPLHLNGWGTVFPDFTVLNVRLRKEYVWEHYGKMDSSDYCRKNLNKLDAYIKNGYYQGESLILTMESSLCSLSTKQIELIIKKYLL